MGKKDWSLVGATYIDLIVVHYYMLQWWLQHVSYYHQ